MHAADDAQRLRGRLAGGLEDALRRIDRRCDGRNADDVRLQLGDATIQLLAFEVIRHGVQEMDILKTGLLERTGEIGNPGRRPVAGNLGTAGVIVGMNEQDTHID